MQWLVRLVSPPGATVLEPFAGSGTTMIACELEGVACVGVEREPGYCDIARARLRNVLPVEDTEPAEGVKPKRRRRKKAADA